MYKIDYKKLYESRIEEINYQIKAATRMKNWGKVNKLKYEKETLLKRIKEL